MVDERKAVMLPIMRELEVYGYRIAYYLLDDEEAAVRVTAAALEELYRYWAFDDQERLSSDELRVRMKRITISKWMEMCAGRGEAAASLHR